MISKDVINGCSLPKPCLQFLPVWLNNLCSTSQKGVYSVYGSGRGVDRRQRQSSLAGYFGTPRLPDKSDVANGTPHLKARVVLQVLHEVDHALPQLVGKCQPGRGQHAGGFDFLVLPPGVTECAVNVGATEHVSEQQLVLLDGLQRRHTGSALHIFQREKGRLTVGGPTINAGAALTFRLSTSRTGQRTV